ncbi:hypothetical protein NM208_g4597 [Fusarium decemcellulare]|uniref:Uncharacterized protein n=1 Tax=Fusarium decemcellulare TaxID=57161 RepID=A0ACC1SK34_9HYPO|nr:hypothetical protein NM208_g4597 [Fusarium decemcellulare]
MRSSLLIAAAALMAGLYLPFAMAQRQLFQGNSILIKPSITSLMPGDANFTAAHFYSYIAPEGYFSFGWWLSAMGDANYSRCAPDKPFDWYEYSSSGGCNTTTDICDVHALNYPSGPPLTAEIDTNYIAWVNNVGPQSIGNLAVSYFNQAHGTFAVGTRRYVSGPGLGTNEAQECLQAFKTLQGIEKKWELPLKFNLTNPCQTQP